MKLLAVPYIPQFRPHACGAAVLEMIYKFYGVEEVSQPDIMKKYEEPELEGSTNTMIATGNLVQDATGKNFVSFWGQVNYQNTEHAVGPLKLFINEMCIPLIVCQQFTEERPKLGHFRIVLGIDDDTVCLHDPDPQTGGKNLSWPISKFMKFWQPTGKNVTGGVFVFISNIK